MGLLFYSNYKQRCTVSSVYHNQLLHVFIFPVEQKLTVDVRGGAVMGGCADEVAGVK